MDWIKNQNTMEKARKDFKTIESALEEMKLGTEIAMVFMSLCYL